MVEQLHEEEFLKILFNKGWPFLVSPALSSLNAALFGNTFHIIVNWSLGEQNIKLWNSGWHFKALDPWVAMHLKFQVMRIQGKRYDLISNRETPTESRKAVE